MSIEITHKAVRIIATAFCTATATANVQTMPEDSATSYIVIENFNTKAGNRYVHAFLDPVYLARRAAPTNTL